MLNLFFRLFLAFNATSLILVVYVIKSQKQIELVSPCIVRIPNYIFYLALVVIMILLTSLSLAISQLLDQDEVRPNSIISIESANNSFLPSYLGYFFVALDVPNDETLYFVYSLIFAFTFFSQTLYFNPIFLLFGYHFYNLTDLNQVRIFVITRKRLKKLSSAHFPAIYQINDYTFIDKE
jgi:hypothetical protein